MDECRYNTALIVRKEDDPFELRKEFNKVLNEWARRGWKLDKIWKDDVVYFLIFVFSN
ncbi:unnamed protein product [marine sediment metagenome]|uniref:DUF4177 domain-containing protein n=1 Tax=marine sediment metagenome TaxID=412755 RepID=X1IVT0_9ZZZZ